MTASDEGLDSDRSSAVPNERFLFDMPQSRLFSVSLAAR
jgi:hypothetical protein